MINTELTPQYDIVPHGLKKLTDDSYHLIFKMIVTFNEFKDGGDINKPMWDRVTKKINEKQWGYVLDLNSISFMDYNENMQVPLLRSLAFNIGTNKLSFSFGQSAKQQNAFDFLAKDEFRLGKPVVNNQKVDQMEKTNGDNIPMGNYAGVLEKAKKYAKDNEKAFEEEKSTSKKDFTSIYASILDDVEIAEKGFGIVRTIYVPIKKDEMPDTLIAATYKIRVLGLETESIYTFQRKTIEGKEKFYHGLAAKYFTNSDFLKIIMMDHDAYKGNLEKVMGEVLPNPDGAYVMGIYKQLPNGNIDDPFDNLYIKGLNAVVKHQDQYHSLSRHSTNYSTKVGGKINDSYQTSGVLTPRSVVLTQDSNFRNNLLFAWRGDNLLVNRNVEAEDEEDTKGEVNPDNTKETESEFIYKNLFEKTDRLIPSSQRQLLFSDKPYHFFIRKVSTSGHHIPLKAEIDENDEAYTLTMEDDLKDPVQAKLAQLIEKITEGGKLVDKEFYFQDKGRISAAAMLGPIKYVTAEFTDQAQQIVLNLKKESQEKRFLFPPQIKFEDFKFLGYLTKDRLKKKETEVLTPKIFVERCKLLEEKIKRIPRKLADRINNIDYLADPRGKFIYFYGNDFPTSKFQAKLLPAFKFEQNYPFFTNTNSLEILVEKNNKNANLKLKLSNPEAYIDILNNLPKGIYNFNLYITDKPINELETSKYSDIKFKVSILDTPDAPSSNVADLITRDTKFPNYWFRKLPANADTRGWKSLKYLEQGKVLRLQHEPNQVEQLLTTHYLKNPTLAKFELFESEYPYDIFIENEGGFEEKNGLKTNIYPNYIKFSYATSTLGDLTGEFFSWKLNDEDLLQAKLDKEAGAILTLNGTEILRGKQQSIEILFIEAINQFVIKSSAGGIFPLKQYVNQQLSASDITFPENVLRYVQYGKYNPNPKLQFKLEDIIDYIVIASNKNPFAQDKKIKFFASSQFQGYYPELTSEFALGALGDAEIDFKVPNNIKPEPPLIKYDKLFKRTEESWAGNTMENTIQSLVCLSLQDDFMKEGKNRLGIILEAFPTSTEDNPKKFSMVGEDITKITKDDALIDLKVEKVIYNESSLPLLKKYLAKDPIKYYGINGTTYKVMEFDPFYNIEQRKWQVVLSFNFMRSETMFMKLYTMKIATGHLLKPLNDAPNSMSNPYVDQSNTSLSIFSDPTEFPIYNEKTFKIRKTATQFELTSLKNTSYKKNVFFVMLMKVDVENNIINQDRIKYSSKLDSLIPFNYYIETPTGAEKSTDSGKILQVQHPKKDVPVKIQITRENCFAVLLLEFEVHDNHDLVLTKEYDWVVKNPLFENKGIRLINAIEFKI